MSHTPLRLEEYFFTRVFFEANPQFSESKESDPSSLEIGFSLEFLKHESDPNRFQLKLTLEGPKADDPPLPYSFDIQIVGLFSVDPDFQHEDISRLVKINGGSMLYSATREFVLMITGRGPWGGLKLPTVNFHAAIADQEEG